MTDIPLPQPSQPDIYSFGFDNSLNVNVPDTSTPTVYDTFDQQPMANVSFGAMATGVASSILIADPKQGLSLGDTKFATAPFKVNMNGELQATTATIGNTTGARIVLDSINNALIVYDSAGNIIFRVHSIASGNITDIFPSGSGQVALNASNLSGVDFTGTTLIKFAVGNPGTTASGDVLQLAQASSGNPLKISNTKTVSTNFVKLTAYTNGTTTNTLWQSNGTTPNGNLSGTNGDVCINADSGKIYVCTGTTNWSALLTNGLTTAGIFGDGSDGNVTISVNTILTGPKYYNNLTVNNGVTLDPNGYPIFILGTLTLNGDIIVNGNIGGDGGNAVGAGNSGGTSVGAAGTGAAARGDALLWGGNAGVNGAAGGFGTTNGGSPNPGANGSNGATTNNVLIGSGHTTTPSGVQSKGGSGFGAGASPGTTGTVGTANASFYTTINDISLARIMLCLFSGTYQYIRASSQNGTAGGAGGGSAGAAQNGGNGGGSGGGGSDAGAMVVFANIITGSGNFKAIGGAGGKGGNGSDGNGTSYGGGGGGMGGTGGNGGIIIVVYKTGSGGFSHDISGGAGGNGGAGGLGNIVGNNGNNGGPGNSGVAGYYKEIQIT